MKVRYLGTMPGYHVLGKRAVVLLPGENDLPDSVAEGLIAINLVERAAGRSRSFVRRDEAKQKEDNQ